jgi:AcrR family transcriptional regulator
MASKSQAQVVDRVQPARSRPGRERVSEIQRRRMLAAMVEAAAEHGGGSVTVAHVVARSGVSRRTFYEIFEDREDCFLAAFDDAIEKAAQRVVPAYCEPRQWTDKVRVGLTRLLGLLDEDIGLGRLLIVEALGAGPRALERRQELLEKLSRAVLDGAHDPRAGKDLPVLTAEGMVGAVLSVLHSRLVAPEPGDLMDLLNPLMAMIVLPYRGRSAAQAELAKSIAMPSANGSKRAADPLHNLNMRLTYRTVMVLSAVAANPGGSNRVMARAAGVSDQGQISKLLARLHGRGLVENTGGNPVRGEPNAWVLTAKGWDVHEAISSSAEPS